MKAITFDFWSTLYQPKTVDYTQRILRLKEAVEAGSGAVFTDEGFAAAVKAARRAWSRTWETEHRTIGASEWLSVLLAQLGVSLDAPHRADIEEMLARTVLEDRPTPAPEVSAVLPELASRYRLAIISDTGLSPGRVLRQLLADDGLLPYFTVCTFSDELGRSKPHADAFLRTLDALKVAPHEAVHVGDLLRTDIAGAQRVGMRAVQYIGLNRDEDDAITPDAVIHRHTELPPLLHRWRNGNAPVSRRN